MQTASTEERQMLRDSIRKLMERHATTEYVRQLDRDQAYPETLYAEWVKAGLIAMPFPSEYGGLDGNVIDMAIIAEELSRKSTDLTMAYGGSVFCGLNVAKKATPAQKQYWIPKLLSGEIKMSISMSEPEAGSDVGAMRTVARRDGDEWVINGQKLWATGAAAKNNVINLYVKTDTNVQYRNGISLFLVDNTTPGIKMRKLDMLGRRCVGTYEIFLDNVRVTADRLVGGENHGWDYLLTGLQVERVVSAASSAGGAQAVVDMATEYARQRHQFGRPIGSFQAIAHMLADMHTEVTAARALVWQAAAAVAEGKDALREISMAKLFASETYVKVSSQAVQVLGGYGYNMEFDVQRHFRDSRAATIAAGSSQMLRNLVANLSGLKVK
jgi:alkylation response protein AidB-like acyl-CoA dehydrogenase